MMKKHKIACIKSLCLVVGLFAISTSALCRDEQTNHWIFFGEEERGWSNKNTHGKSILLMDCIYDAKRRRMALSMSGYLNKYLESSTKYWLWTVNGKDRNHVYTATDDYFGYVYMFTADLPAKAERLKLQFCAQSMTQIDEEECENFSAANFDRVFEDICVKAKGRQ